ncbi:unknown [Firmicutes bacterium CAG:137]|nr:unknown [Firmicutes bacterium CAG:137]
MVHAGGEKLALHVHPAQVLVSVALPEANQAHGLVSVQLLLALLQVDIEVLGGVFIEHIHGDVELHPAHQVHHIHEGVQGDQHIAVRPVTDDVRYIVQKGLHTLLTAIVATVGGVQLGVAAGGCMGQGVPGQAHQGDSLLPGVQIQEHHGVGSGAFLVGAAQEHRGCTFLPGANGLVCLRHFHGAANPQVSTADQEQNHQQYAG